MVRGVLLWGVLLQQHPRPHAEQNRDAVAEEVERGVEARVVVAKHGPIDDGADVVLRIERPVWPGEEEEEGVVHNHQSGGRGDLGAEGKRPNQEAEHVAEGDLA